MMHGTQFEMTPYVIDISMIDSSHKINILPLLTQKWTKEFCKKKKNLLSLNYNVYFKERHKELGSIMV